MLKIKKPVSFDWDKNNINKNWLKHRVQFKEAEEIFFNKPLKVFPDPKHSKNEKRIAVLGHTNHNRKLAIVFTIRNKKIRIITARDQSRKERKAYEQKK